MSKYELKTKKNETSVEDFLNSISDESKRKDSFVILSMMKKVSKSKPKMWGSSIVGFGDLKYKYASGQEGDWFKAGFSPRKQNLTIYMHCLQDRDSDLFKKLGKYKTGKGCLYINKLADVDLKVLEKIIEKAVKGK